MTPAAIDKLFADYILLGLTDITVCGGGSFCSLAALHGDRPMLTYPSRPPANTPLCLQNARIIGPARHVNGDGSPCTPRLGTAPAVSRDACAGWPGPPAASSWKTQLSLSWGNQRQFDEVLRAVVKVGGRHTRFFFFFFVCLGLRADVFVA
jgi:hypothetical protein